MKSLNILSLTFISAALTLLFSCQKDDPAPKGVNVSGIYILDYGNYSGVKTTLSAYHASGDSVTLDAYEKANGVALNSNVQNYGIANGLLYLTSNNGDKIDIVDAKTLQAGGNPISENIEKPRHIVFNGNTAYVSCWAADADWSTMSTSYIAKIDLSSRSVSKIALPGGPEGLAIANGKLYAALNYVDSVAVMDLSDETFTYIATPAVCSYFLKDNQNNLYVSLVSTFSDFSVKTGLGYINTTTDQITDTIFKDGISSDYGSIMAFNKDKSKIYIIASSWVEEAPDTWVTVGSVLEFDVMTKTYTPLLSGAKGINGISVNPTTDDIYSFVTYTDAPDSMKIYSPVGTLKTVLPTGEKPQMAVFVMD